MKARLFLLILPLFLLGCDGVSIIRLRDGKVVGKDSPKGEYRDMVLACDEGAGKVAIIEWGKYASTIKIVQVAEGSLTKHSVAVGRLNGIGGAEYYDLTFDQYIFHDCKGLHVYGKDSQTRELPNPLPEGFWASKIVPCKDGLLITCGRATGDYCGCIVYRYVRKGNSISRIYETEQAVRETSSQWDKAVLVEDIKGDYANRHIVSIALDGRVLSQTIMPRHTPDLVRIRNGTLYQVFGTNMCCVQQASLETGAVLREVRFPGVSGDISGFDLKDNLVVVAEETSRGLSATVLDMEAKRVVKRFKGQWAWSELTLMKYNGDLYCIVSN
jgi:hypothetical protein